MPTAAALSDEVIAGLLLSVIFAGQHTSAVMGVDRGPPARASRVPPPVLAEQEAVLGGGEIDPTACATSSSSSAPSRRRSGCIRRSSS